VSGVVDVSVRKKTFSKLDRRSKSKTQTISERGRRQTFVELRYNSISHNLRGLQDGPEKQNWRSTVIKTRVSIN